MRAARLRHRIELQSPAYAKDAVGQDIITYTTADTVWGSIEPLRGKEFIERGIDSSKITAKIVLRYYSGLNTKWRIKHDSDYFDILNIIDIDKRHRQIELLVKQIPAGDI